jgi:hypothetical protein
LGGTSSLPNDTDHQHKGKLLAEQIVQNPGLLDLSRTPLLCAVLCALAYNRKGAGSLPQRRIELYDVALTMLTGRRDAERDVRAGRLGSGERLVLLESLAQWLIRNGQSEISRENALKHLDRTLKSLHQVTMSAQEALRDLLERSVLREPAAGVIDFVHRTFEEYLAARWMNEQGDFGALVAKANDPAFGGVIALVAGLSRPNEADALIAELIAQAESGQEHLYALATSCVDACLRVDPQVVRRLERYFATLVPPQEQDDMLLLATGGNTSVRLIQRHLSARPRDSYETCIEVLARIGTEEAFEVLTRLPVGYLHEMAQSLVDAWSFFPPIEYAQRVLLPLDRPTHVTIRDDNRMDFTALLPLDYVIHAQSKDELFIYWTNPRINHLHVDGDMSINCLAHAATINGVESVTADILFSITGDEFQLPSIISELTSLDLRFLSPFKPDSRFNCRLLRCFPKLVELQFEMLDTVVLDNIEVLNDLPDLRLLEINDPNLTGWRAISLAVPSLQTLRLPGWPNEDFTAFSGCTGLESLDASDSEVTRLTGIENMPGLRSIVLNGCVSLTDITGLDELHFLESVDLRGCEALDEESADILRGLPGGVEIELSGSPFENLEDRLGDDIWAGAHHVVDPDDIGDWYEESLIRTIVGIDTDAEDFTRGWLVGTLQDIEYPSSSKGLGITD